MALDEIAVQQSLAKYNLADAAIEELAAEYMPLTTAGPTDEDGFKVVTAARKDVKRLRLAVEATRRDLKRDALDYGRRVDTEAKRITGLLRPIEDHLIEQERPVLDEKARIKAEALLAKEAEELRRREKEAAERLEEMRKADGRLAAQRKEQEEAQRKLDGERAELEAEKRALRAAEQERAAAERKEADARAAEARRKAATERAERLKPDFDKVLVIAERVAAIEHTIQDLAVADAVNELLGRCALDIEKLCEVPA